MSEDVGNPIRAHIFKAGQGTDAEVQLTFPARPGRIIRLVHIAASITGGSTTLSVTGLQDGQTYSIDLSSSSGNFFFGGGVDGVHADENVALVATLAAAGATFVGKLNVAVVYDLPTKTAA
jgi:hypothetical protein